MTPVIVGCVALGSFVLATLSAIGSKVLRDFSRHELEGLCERRRSLDTYREILDQHESVALAVESLQTLATCFTVGGAVAWMASSRIEAVGEAGTMIWFLLAASLLLIMGTVWIPWAIVEVFSAPFLFYTWRLWQAVAWAIVPFSLGAMWFVHVARRLAGEVDDAEGEEEAFEDEIRSIVSEGMHEGLIKADAGEMIEGVIELGDADVSDVMTPRSHIDAVEVNSSWRDVLNFVVRCRRTRIPVYDENLDRIVGILYVKDLLPELSKTPTQDRHGVRQLVREPWFIPKTKPVDELLREFLHTHNHLAIVLDEYEAVAGLVTIEDVLEEIVGEIVDEHDAELIPEIHRIDEQTAEVLGHAHLSEINDQLGLTFSEDDEYDTLSGLVLSRIGRIPNSGEELTIDNVRLTIVQANRRRIDRIRIQLLERTSKESA